MADKLIKTPEEYSDLGNAKRYARLFSNEVLYAHEESAFFTYTGNHWELSTSQFFEHRIDSIVADILSDLDNYDEYTDKSKIAACNKWALKTQTHARIQGMLKCIKVIPGIVNSVSDLDPNPMHLGVTNGVVDLETGELSPSHPEDLISKTTTVHYDQGAYCPMWLSYLDEIFKGDQDLIDFFQRVVGSWLIGDPGDALVVLSGDYGVAKSSAVNTIKSILGDYSILGDSVQESPYYKMLVLGKRLAVFDHVEDETLSQLMIKQIMSRDTIIARNPRGDSVRATLPTSPVFLSNSLPELSPNNPLFRMVLILDVPLEVEDKNFEYPLDDIEGPGILAWAVRGSITYLNQGLTPPKSVLDATYLWRGGDSGEFKSQLPRIKRYDKIAEKWKHD